MDQSIVSIVDGVGWGCSCSCSCRCRCRCRCRQCAKLNGCSFVCSGSADYRLSSSYVSISCRAIARVEAILFGASAGFACCGVVRLWRTRHFGRALEHTHTPSQSANRTPPPLSFSCNQTMYRCCLVWSTRKLSEPFENVPPTFCFAAAASNNSLTLCFEVVSSLV